MKIHTEVEPSIMDDIAMRAETPLVDTHERIAERTDAEIRDAARDAITAITTIAVGQLGIAVHQGHVELSGHVDSGSQRQVIEEIIDRLPGVRGVTNLLEVRLQPDSIDERSSEPFAGDAARDEVAGTWIAIISIVLACIVGTYLFWAKMVSAWPF